MKTWVRKTLAVGVLAAGALLFAPGAAQADGHQDTGGNAGLLNGNQVFAPVAVPLNVVGNAIGVAGEADAAGAGINFVESGQDRRGGQRSSDNVGVGNGNQAYLPISAPVNIVGNSGALLGLADARGVGVNRTEHGRTGRGGGGQDSGGNAGILNGNQVYAPVDVPVNLCGNALGLLGLAQSQAACINDDRRESASQKSAGNAGAADGTQVYSPVSAPLNIAGTAIGVAGEAGAAGAATTESGRGGDRGHGRGQWSHHNRGFLNGGQFGAPINIPINVCGNSLAVFGGAHASGFCGNDIDFGGRRGGDWDLRGHGGLRGDRDFYDDSDLRDDFVYDGIGGLRGDDWDDDDFIGDDLGHYHQGHVKGDGCDDDKKGHGKGKGHGNGKGNGNGKDDGYGGKGKGDKDDDGKGKGHNSGKGDKDDDGKGKGNGKGDDDGYGGKGKGDKDDDGKGHDGGKGNGKGDQDDDEPYVNKPGRESAPTEAGSVDGLTQTLSNAGGLSVLTAAAQ